MKLIPSTILQNSVRKSKRGLAVCGLWLVACIALAQSEQQTRAGLSLSAEMEKSLSQFFDLKIEEELRLSTVGNGFDRSVTTAGIDWSFFDNHLKLGGYYAFMYLYNSDKFFEPRHRAYINLSYKQTLGRFTLSWRGRLQGTYRDENLGNYKINPKYISKNKFQVEYSIWGRPWKPFVSCDLYNDLNNPAGNYLTRIRYQAGATWRLNRTDYIDFFVRSDQYLDLREAQNFALGVAFKFKK